MEEKRSYLGERFRAFGAAYAGLKAIMASEPHFRLHFLFACGAVYAGFVFSVQLWEWFMILSSIAAVLCSEIFNSAIERLCDHVTPEHHEDIRFVKDAGAAAVLVACIFAAVTGCIVFLPRMLP